ncbi:outer membrane beta-barrel protein [Aquamicrobium defluvii]|uniref:outer membrane beta-barrel protein n=1 Tax=Aquamicrobium defluvii TaxID=69279 RepID=UPI001FE1F7F9|nr:outer membrane beta-barrel protein [Aquamicrobium defluvii]
MGKLRTLMLAASMLVPAFPVQAQEMELRGNMNEPLVPDIRVQQPVRSTQTLRALADEELPPETGTAQGIDSLVDAPLDETTPPPVPQPRRRTATVEEPAAEASPNPRAGAILPEEPTRQNLREEHTGAIEQIRRAPEDDPFAAPGMRLGTFLLRPSLEQGLTATSNADGSATGESAVLSETTLRLNATSDWSRHSADITGYTTWRKSLSGQHLDEVRGRIDGTLNLDLERDWRATARLGYEASPESASSPIAIAGTASQPLRHQFDGSAGIEKALGKLRLGLTGEALRTVYEDAKLSTGGTLSQKHRGSTLYTARLRAGYEISPALTPFVEIEGGRRIYDERVDPSGYSRSSDRLGARAGTQFDLGEKFGGELAAGWLRESFDDDRLAALSAATIDGTVRWSPQRGTDLHLRGSTTFEGATAAGESGSVLYALRLTGERQIRANLTANALLGFDWREYSGSDDRDLIYTAEAGLTWWMNRYAGLTIRARHETLDGNRAGRDAKTNSIFVGITARR